MAVLRVLVVDDNPLVRTALARFVEMHPHLTVVGEAHTGGEAVQQVQRLQPDLVLLDLGLPDLSGWEVARQIKVQPAAPYVIVLTLEEAAPYQDVAVRVGVDACLAKAEVGTHLLPLIAPLLAQDLDGSGGQAS